MSDTDTYIVVWCDSPLGLISTRVDPDNKPIQYKSSELPDVIRIPASETGVFGILKRRDGTKVAVNTAAVYSTFGWIIS